MASASERGLPFRALPYTGVRCLIVPTLAARSILDEMSSSGPLRILHHSLSGISPTTRRQAAECAIGAWCEGSDLHLFEDLCRHLQVWEQARAADPDGNPLSPLDTLILHELTEMAAIRTGLPPEAAHVVASVMERMCARAVELADAAAYLLRRTAGCSRPGADRDTRSTASDAEKAPPVLVVDDSSMSRHVVATLLRRLGQPVIEAADGEQAQALSREHGPRLLVLDIGCPTSMVWPCWRASGSGPVRQRHRRSSSLGIGHRTRS